MTAAEMNAFIHSMTFEDATITLHGKTYWCLGLVYDNDCHGLKNYRIEVYEVNEKSLEFTDKLFSCHSPSKEECLSHFLNDKYWNGKSFYEIAADAELVDL